MTVAAAFQAPTTDCEAWIRRFGWSDRQAWCWWHAIPRPPWCARLETVEILGPFVDVDYHDDTPIATFEDGAVAVCAFATTAPPGPLTRWLDTTEPPGVDVDLIDGRLGVDPELGTAVVQLASKRLNTSQLLDASRWIVPRIDQFVTR